MAPSITSPKPDTATRSGLYFAGAASNSREATPTTDNPGPVAVAKSNTELDSLFSADLTNIRNLITCSICDQLLYEPWTLGCGHTYCYSCLCNWFVPNKRKKTCPECRDLVKQIPAPSFLVKQLVEIFTKRSELMPSDESIEQHQNKRLEEMEDVERDKNNPGGLFKGAFPPRNRDLIFDEQDGVLRCPRCLTEHEGGPTCMNCFLPVDNGYDFSDIDDDQFDGDIDVEDLELDLEGELAGRHHHHFGHFMGIPHFGFQHFHHTHHIHHGESVTSNSDSSNFNGNSDEDEGEYDDDSLQDFVVPDDEDPGSAPRRQFNNRSDNAHTITISDDDSDEGGAVRDRRPRRVVRAARDARSSGPSVVELSSSETGDLNEEAIMLRDAGWSPLSQENDSDAEEADINYGYDFDDEGSEERNTEDGSDTETIGNRGSDDDDGDDDDRSRSDLSETPQPAFPLYGEATPSNASGEDEEREDSEEGMPNLIDRDGDTEMSASPGASRTSRSPSVNTDGGYGYSRGENLGVTTQVYDVEDDSSDGTNIRPPPRRRPRRALENARMQQYDPRISMIFAEHQQSIRGAHDHHFGLDELGGGVQRVEPASRTRRTSGYRYRLQPQRRSDPLRSSTSPTTTRVISSSNRATRLPRQYQIRN